MFTIQEKAGALARCKRFSWFERVTFEGIAKGIMQPTRREQGEILRAYRNMKEGRSYAVALQEA